MDTATNNTNKFNYENTEVKMQQGGKKVVRKVSIKNGKGYKSITKYHKNKKLNTIKKTLKKAHIKSLQLGKFVPGLFKGCSCNKK